MIFFTPIMRNILSLVLVASLTIHCQSVTVRDDASIYDPSASPKSFVYQNVQIATPEALRQDPQLQYYKASRRSDSVPSPTYQYASEDGQEQEYVFPTVQHLQTRAENDPYSQRGLEQLGKRLSIPGKKQPLVEQYLKEVTPTTKTVYSRPGNYLRSNGQAQVRGIKQQPEEIQRNTLKQSPYQYVLQSDLRQKPRGEPQYVYTLPKPVQPQQIEQQPPSADLAAFQNALLAHQKVLETESQDESRSSIHVTHSVPKKPVRKLVKPKPTTEEDVEYYAQVQQYQQAQQKQPVFEPKEPAPVSYQARLQYPKEDISYQASTEEPQIYQQQYQPARQLVKKPIRPVKYQPTAEYQLPSEVYQEPETTFEYKPLTKTAEPTQYQQPSYSKQGPKYLPEPKTRFQPSALEETKYQQVPAATPFQPLTLEETKYQQVPTVMRQQEALLKYQAAIAELQSAELSRAREQNVKQQSGYQEQGAQPVRYQLQYPEETQQVPTQEKEEVSYARPEQLARYQQPAYRQPQQRVRYFRNLHRPPVSYSNYE